METIRNVLIEFRDVVLKEEGNKQIQDDLVFEFERKIRLAILTEEFNKKTSLFENMED